MHFPLMCIANRQLRYFFRPLLKFMIFVKNPIKIPVTLFIIFSNSKIKSIFYFFTVHFFFFFFFFFDYNFHKFQETQGSSPSFASNINLFLPSVAFHIFVLHSKTNDWFLYETQHWAKNQCKKSMDWFLYDNGLRHERVSITNQIQRRSFAAVVFLQSFYQSYYNKCN